MIVRANGTLVSMTEDHKPEDDLEKARIYAAEGSVPNLIEWNITPTPICVYTCVNTHIIHIYIYIYVLIYRLPPPADLQDTYN